MKNVGRNLSALHTRRFQINLNRMFERLAGDAIGFAEPAAKINVCAARAAEGGEAFGRKFLANGA